MCWREDRHECNHSLGLSYNITAFYLIPHAASVLTRSPPRGLVVYRSSSARFWTELGKSGLLFHKVPTGHGADRSRCSYTDVSHLSHTSVIRPGRIRPRRSGPSPILTVTNHHSSTPQSPRLHRLTGPTAAGASASPMPTCIFSRSDMCWRVETKHEKPLLRRSIMRYSCFASRSSAPEGGR